MTNSVSFGRALRPKFFFEDKFVPLNNGSFGSCPRSLLPVLHDFRQKMEQLPDLFLQHDVFLFLDKNREKLSSLVHCDPEDLAFILNASYGTNSVLRSLSFNPGDKILCFSTVYNAVESNLAFMEDHHKAKLVPVVLTYPLSDQDILDLAKETIERELTAEPSVPIRVAIFDAISSVPGVRFPFEAMIKLVREYKILSLVDGAHAAGQIPLNLREADPDFFVSNLHKWLFVPRASAFLYVPKRNQGLVHPAVINSSYKRTSKGEASGFQGEFVWPGTIDFSTHLCIIAALEFRQSLGGEEAIQGYCNDLARQGGQLVADRWGTEVLENDDRTLTVAMTNVRLPFANKQNKPVGEVTTAFKEKWILEHATVGQPYCHNGTWYVRLSAQVYNDLDDFSYFAEATQKICKELEE
ncbi:pyridoxal phosphate-dependent transferase [Fennellomyces sp. T-0311]|nr:pyridoxal phosphate-dependent transferase [Fennellomyces sp. T-0311]